MAVPHSKNARLFYRAAFQRLDDGQFLLDAGRTTPSVYLAGYSVECIIKALILSAVPDAEQAGVMGLFRGARAHEYEWLLQLYQERGGSPMPPSLLPDFVRVNTWSTDLRYSPGMLMEKEATAFIESAVRILEWADGRL